MLFSANISARSKHRVLRKAVSREPHWQPATGLRMRGHGCLSKDRPGWSQAKPLAGAIISRSVTATPLDASAKSLGTPKSSQERASRASVQLSPLKAARVLARASTLPSWDFPAPARHLVGRGHFFFSIHFLLTSPLSIATLTALKTSSSRHCEKSSNEQLAISF